MTELSVDCDFRRHDGCVGNVLIDAREAEPSYLGLDDKSSQTVEIVLHNDDENLRLFYEDDLRYDIPGGRVQVAMRAEAFEAFVEGMIRLRADVRAKIFADCPGVIPPTTPFRASTPKPLES